MVIVRELYRNIKPYLFSKEAIVITGMRRVGKTTLLHFIYGQVKSQNKLFIDLENPLNRKLFEESDYEKIKNSLEMLGLKINRQRAYLFLDEIQFVRNIPSVMKYFIDHFKTKFFVTGSASFYLKNLFSESLAGRKYIFELFPFSFVEFLQLKGAELKMGWKHSQITEPVFEIHSRYYEEYINFGGFPEVIEKRTKKEKLKALNDIFSSYYQMEVERFSDFKKSEKIRDLILLLAERVGSKLDIQKLAQELGISRITVGDFLAFLEGTYFISLVKPFSKSRDVEIRKTPKIYLCDSGMANSLAQVSRGSLFEQNVFQLLRLGGHINYYQKKTGAEIDFMVDKKRAYEVKITPSKADLNGLSKLSKSIGIGSYAVVSFNYSELRNTLYGFEL